jgi:hypothetical protein
LGWTRQGDTFWKWKESVIEVQAGQSDWRLCDKCKKAFDDWWTSYLTVRTLKGSDIAELQQEARKSGFEADYPFDYKKPQRFVVTMRHKDRDEAVKDLKAATLLDAFDIAEVIVKGGEQRCKGVDAFSEEDAWDACRLALGVSFEWKGKDWAVARRVFGKSSIHMVKVEVIRAPKRALLGLINKPGHWRVTYQSEFCVTREHTEPGAISVVRRLRT